MAAIQLEIDSDNSLRARVTNAETAQPPSKWVELPRNLTREVMIGFPQWLVELCLLLTAVEQPQEGAAEKKLWQQAVLQVAAWLKSGRNKEARMLLRIAERILLKGDCLVKQNGSWTWDTDAVPLTIAQKRQLMRMMLDKAVRSRVSQTITL